MIAFSILVIEEVQAQEENYTLTPAPDVWYNNVDGVRLGIRVLGEVEGTFKDGPHRLDAGVWLGTNFPDLPVSYYVSLTEPIPAISSFGNEGNIQLISSIRTGYNQQTVVFNKRWQTGFNEFRYKELSVNFSQEKLIDYEYRPYDQVWQNEWKSLAGVDFILSDFTPAGKFDAAISVKQNVNSNSEAFTIGTVELKQQLIFNENFNLGIRAFSGLASDNTAPEYLFGRSYRQPVKWLNNGFTRAQGTLPNSWLDDGLFQIAGGANLRGYTYQDFEALEDGGFPLYNSVFAINSEFEFPNFINSRMDKSMIGDFVHLRSYLFVDAGRIFEDDFETNTRYSVMGDAGIGFQFSLNIPDFLGKERGFAIRYEIPFWLSDPAGDDTNFKFRNLIGIGAVISL
ncbi:MAG: hypothetical protein WD059_11585 [Balneolaceae bacterium]